MPARGAAAALAIIQLMPPLMLHHYDLSPFSEKVRLMFGLKGLAWQSVIIPDVLPKPDYLALTGGYRRTPSLQIGADVYCDTRLIAEVLERRVPQPTLFPGGRPGPHHVVEQWAETDLFWPCALAVTGANADALPPAFHADRAAMRGRPPPAAARVRQVGEAAHRSVTLSLREVEAMLVADEDFLLGHAPGLADLAVYHALWFLDRFPRPLLEAFAPSPALRDWLARIAALGHGTRTELGAADAIAIARASTPAGGDTSCVDFASGTRVSIAPDARTSAPVVGEVVACSVDEIAIRHVDARAGIVHVHFPRAGYRITREDGCSWRPAVLGVPP